MRAALLCLATLVGAGCGTVTVSKVDECQFAPVSAVVRFPAGHGGSAPVFQETPAEQMVLITDLICTNNSRDLMTRTMTLVTSATSLLVLILDAGVTTPLGFGTPIQVPVSGLTLQYETGGSGECTVLGKVLDAMRSEVTDIADCGV